jgi:16S rRNA (adenine1518-N6/adenine1519-N6)-dimethyltransferase
MEVKAKKHLGQHFLTDRNICRKIVEQIPNAPLFAKVLEIGPGMGALTEFLYLRSDFSTVVMDIDTESIAYLKNHFPALQASIVEADFLRVDLSKIMGPSSFAVVGNFPYNISSQILFKVVENRQQIPFLVGMFQKEVAERIAEKPGNKKYGILSVLLQAYYEINYCFTVHENVFHPPPKVKSGVITMIRNNREQLPCDEVLFFKVVKMAFNQRRKTIRNSLKPLLNNCSAQEEIFDQRPEKLGVDEFVALTKLVQNYASKSSLEM